jgi:hypothetical protein
MQSLACKHDQLDGSLCVLQPLLDGQLKVPTSRHSVTTNCASRMETLRRSMVNPSRVMKGAWCLSTRAYLNPSLALSFSPMVVNCVTTHKDARPEMQCWLAETSHPNRFTIVSPSQPAVHPQTSSSSPTLFANIAAILKA